MGGDFGEDEGLEVVGAAVVVLGRVIEEEVTAVDAELHEAARRATDRNAVIETKTDFICIVCHTFGREDIPAPRRQARMARSAYLAMRGSDSKSDVTPERLSAIA